MTFKPREVQLSLSMENVYGKVLVKKKSQRLSFVIFRLCWSNLTHANVEKTKAKDEAFCDVIEAVLYIPRFFVDFLNFNPLTLKKLFNILLIFYGKYKLKLLLKKLSI